MGIVVFQPAHHFKMREQKQNRSTVESIKVVSHNINTGLQHEWGKHLVQAVTPMPLLTQLP